MWGKKQEINVYLLVHDHTIYHLNKERVFFNYRFVRIGEKAQELLAI